MKNNEYEVIIVGGGPVGAALGIELGLQNIQTLILEKHDVPLKTPRAQSLSARTMEFFLRWGIDDELMKNLLLPESFPQAAIWCNHLFGESYLVTSWGDNRLEKDASPKQGVRSALWVTEAVLRNRLKDFPSVTFLTEQEVQDIEIRQDRVLVSSWNRHLKCNEFYQAQYLACCDGANGITKSKLKNASHALSDQTRMLSVMFKSENLMQEKAVDDGIMYFILGDGSLAFVGPIDLNTGLWQAQIIWKSKEKLPDEASLSKVLDQLVGKEIDKEILDFYFWDMQVKIADFFSLQKRVFWLGDSAHAFAPTGGLGLNTGLGDSQNLAWKIASVIRGEFSESLLDTYEKERHPVWLANLDFAKKNAEEFIQLKEKYPSGDAFVKAYADLGSRYLSSSGLTLGYGFMDSPLTRSISQKTNETDHFKYTPKVLPGYFLPHVTINNASIYHLLSPVHWTLIASRLDEKEAIIRSLDVKNLKILKVEPNIYPFTYILIRPDWHISRVGNDIDGISGPIEENYSCDTAVF